MMKFIKINIHSRAQQVHISDKIRHIKIHFETNCLRNIVCRCQYANCGVINRTLTFYCSRGVQFKGFRYHRSIKLIRSV